MYTYIHIYICIPQHSDTLHHRTGERTREREMGNIITRRSKKAKVMKIDGETFQLKTPATASDVTKEYPGFMLLDSDDVKNFGVRADPLDPNQILKPKKTYFLVDLPKLPPERAAAKAAEESSKFLYRRVMSGIHIGAKERLELMMLSRRTVSDVTIARSGFGDGPEPEPETTRVKLRLPRAQVTKLVEESRDASEMAERIVGLYVGNSGDIHGGCDGNFRRKLGIGEKKGNSNPKAHKKRVSFAVDEGREIAVR
ncbi:PREDICTED: uncharacterized protein At1g66480-like [Tarenaya hassleriana]|uniref:uncharacterized protein At1g66480-like n=1 Tax=Tarenaya hassleriana TaxID=28532 RepID=UPI00053C7F85|nr:PREDICTED: uncharacterized protein At1g66480-like [Tarenaya hassleriana]